jgi:glyoxylase-like metal-dependent hydrolase (beta-lactamase superfamily II)
MALNRRTLLASTAASLAAGSLAAGSLAALTLPSGAAGAPYRFKQGGFEVMVVSDGHLVVSTGLLAPDLPPAERAALLKTAGQTGEQYQSPTNVTLIRNAADLILLDMGAGDRFMPTAGKLWDNLKAAGIDKDKITKVVFTHGHPDHLWGAVDELDELVLPQATCYVAAPEWDFWASADALRGLPAERAGFVTGARRNFAAIKERVKMIQPGDDIVTGLRAIASHGHTQGHISLEIAGGAGLIVGGDALTHKLISFQHPDWRFPADHVPDQAAVTRRRLLDRLAAERMALIGYHLPYPGLGHVERKDGGYRFVPVA